VTSDPKSILRGKNREARALALRDILAKERGIDGILELIRVEADADVKFELRAALSVEMNRPAALRLVETVSGNDSNEIKAMVKEAAIQFGDAETIQTIADRFDNLSPDDRLRPLLAEMVREIRNPEAIEGLTRLASMVAETDFAQDELTWSALVALAEMGTAASVDGIITVAESLKAERNEGMKLVFARIRSSEALPVLIPTAKGQGRDVRLETRLWVIPTLGAFPDEEAVKTLTELTADSDPRISKVAQMTLQRKAH
jgi:HEAT repeat protein